MSNPSQRSPGELQLAILEVLWKQSEATVTEVHTALLPTRGQRPTTISTTLSKMEKRGLVEHREEGRTFVYRALVQKGEIRRSMITDVLERAFSGRAIDMVSMMLREGDFDPEELDALRAELAARQNEASGSDGGDE